MLVLACMTTPVVAGQKAADALVFGFLSHLSGPRSAGSAAYLEGLEAAVAAANAEGGVAGRNLVVRAGEIDDFVTVTPSQLVAKHRFVAIVGLPDGKAGHAVADAAKAAEVPLIDPMAGGVSPVMGLRPSLQAQADRLIAHLDQTGRFSRIGVLHEDSAHGRLRRDAVVAAMRGVGLVPAVVTEFPKGTIAVKSSLLRLRRASAEVVVTIGPEPVLAEFARLADKTRFHPAYAALSDVDAVTLAVLLPKTDAEFLISTAVPFPWDRKAAIVESYALALSRHAPRTTRNFKSLEGFIAGRLAIASTARRMVAGEEGDPVISVVGDKSRTYLVTVRRDTISAVTEK